MTMETLEKQPFFLRDRSFYRSLFRILIVVAGQNLVNYSVNMADNIMLGNYSQSALSGASCVNQIFFLIQQLTMGFGEGMTVITAQYWGQRRTEPICRMAGVALKLSVLSGIAVFILLSLFPVRIMGIFSRDPEIIAQGVAYLKLVKWSFLFYFISAVLTSLLRSVETVRIAFVISVVSLVTNVCINSMLIYGRFGLPELGVTGAAVGTLTARALELAILLWYLAVKDRKLHLFRSDFLKPAPEQRRDYFKVAAPVILSQVLWAVSVPMQTAVLGHLSSDAIAANSVASTFYQYLKVIVVAAGSASTVVIGMMVGRGDRAKVKVGVRTLEVMDLSIGLVLGAALFVLRRPLLSLYSLTPTAMELTDRLIRVMSVIMVGMSYQMPVGMGAIRGGGDTRFGMVLNIIGTWGIVMPLTLMSAFWWKWSVVAVVWVIQSDQLFKCLPVFFYVRHDEKWIRKLTK